jgi:calreticulin
MLSKFVLACVAATASAEVLYKETFGEKWEDSWVTGKAGDKSLGKFTHTAGKFFGGDEADAKGIMTSEDAKHYFLSTAFDKPISNAGKDLVIQYSVKFTETADCGGSYIKLLQKFEPKEFDNETPYNIMFGPDQCGGTKRVHAIFTYKGENKLKTTDVSLSIYDTYTHLFTFVIKKDQTYEIFIDNESKASGKIEDDWEVLPAKKINDPEVSKPADWVEDSQMDDPTDKKPEGYDDIKENIVDPDASKPEDWDDEDDGEWEAPTIKNPEFKGAWKAKRIDNPEYKGEWVHPEIANPEYKPDPTLHESESYGLGFELWQVKSGSLFDNIIITDSLDEAKAFAKETFEAAKEGEKKAKEDADKAEEEAKKAEEEKKKAEEPKEEEKKEEGEEAEKDEL